MRRLAALAVALLTTVAVVEAQGGDGCVDCHRNPDFLVTNPKLHAYFQDWERSVHAQEDVSCADCHGGNPELSEKDAAHGGNLSESIETSAVNFKNIPETCGDCHDEVRDGYVESSHYKHLVEEREDRQGPSCVTCHGSMLTGVLDVTNVEKACGRCHNEETENHPEIPEKARIVLNKFLSMHRFYRYIGIRIDPGESKPFLAKVDERLHELSVLWHTFDLEKIEKETNEVLDVFKDKRDEIRRKRREKTALERSGRPDEAPPETSP